MLERYTLRKREGNVMVICLCHCTLTHHRNMQTRWYTKGSAGYHLSYFHVSVTFLCTFYIHLWQLKLCFFVLVSLHSDCLVALGNVQCPIVCASWFGRTILNLAQCVHINDVTVNSQSSWSLGLFACFSNRCLSSHRFHFQVGCSVFSHQQLHQRRNKNGCLTGERILLNTTGTRA